MTLLQAMERVDYSKHVGDPSRRQDKVGGMEICEVCGNEMRPEFYVAIWDADERLACLVYIGAECSRDLKKAYERDRARRYGSYAHF